MRRSSTLPRGGPLARHTELRRTASPSRSPLVARRRPQADRPADFPPTVVELAWIRCNATCERCGLGLRWDLRGSQWSAHHRHPKGMGGSRRSALGQVSNCLIACGRDNASGCHGAVHRSRMVAEPLGYLVPSGADPAAAPVLVARRIGGRAWVLLTPDGGYLPAPAPEGVGL